MKIYKLMTIMLILGIIIGSCCSFVLYSITMPTNIINMKGYNMTNVNGFYVRGQYYCVMTKGRNSDVIANTETHEQCHALVYKDYEHFCTDVDVKRPNPIAE